MLDRVPGVEGIENATSAMPVLPGNSLWTTLRHRAIQPQTWREGTDERLSGGEDRIHRVAVTGSTGAT